MAWELDMSHSSVKWSAQWNGLVTMGGPFKNTRVKMELDDDNPLMGSVEGTVDSPSFDSFVYRMNARLLSPAYLDAWRYPNIVFKSKEVRPGADDTHFQIVGDLTLRNTTKEVVMNTAYLGEAVGRTGGKVRGYSTVIEINWREYLEGPPPTDPIDLFSDIITVNIELVANQTAR